MPKNLVVDFIKCHGAGNDFIIVDETKNESVPEHLKTNFARRVGDRKNGIGSDGIIFVSSVDERHPRMRFFNPDGSVAEMSGNGIRCASRVCFEGTYKNQSPLTFKTLGGDFKTENFFSSEHNMPLVKVTLDTISTNPENILKDRTKMPFIGQNVQVADTAWLGTIISMGNPHLIIPVDHLHSIDLIHLGDALEHHPIFLNRANISFVQVLDSAKILVQTHERGVGLTLSCGTGMTASVIAQVLNGSVHNNAPVEVHTAGGIVWVTPTVREDGIAAHLTGNATLIYKGTSHLTVEGEAIDFASDTAFEKEKTYPDEHEEYLKLVSKSLFDTSILKGTSLDKEGINGYP